MACNGSATRLGDPSCWCRDVASATDFAPPGQHPIGPAAVVHASCMTCQIRSRPARTCSGPPGSLVGEHDSADRQPGPGHAQGAVRRSGTGTARGGVDNHGRRPPFRPRRGRSRHRPRNSSRRHNVFPAPSSAWNRMPLVWKSSRLRRCSTMSVIDREDDRAAAGQVQFPGVPDGLDLTLHGRPGRPGPGRGRGAPG